MRISLLRAAAFLVCATVALGASKASVDQPPDGDYRQAMRQFVQDISAYAKGLRPRFAIIPQNGQELLTTNGEANGPLAKAYTSAIDGVGREDLFYGYNRDNVATPAADRDYMLAFTDLARRMNLTVMVTDYCSKQARMDDSYAQNAKRGYISFAANRRDLDDIPAYPKTPYNASTSDVRLLKDARNFLYLIDPGRFKTKKKFLDAVRATNHDLVVVDLFWDVAALTAADVTAMKRKANGRARLAVAYMSIGEAEDYRYYWKPEWKRNPPAWLGKINPDWAGCYKVHYWDKNWQDIIFGNNSSYLKKVLDAGFDGAYLDIIDAFEYFEEGGR